MTESAPSAPSEPSAPAGPRLKLAFIGSHGVGKTTLCYALAARLKARDVALDVIHEVARRCPMPINEETGVVSESWILHSQIADELVACWRYPVVICDRSALDNYVYLLVAARPQPALETLVDVWMKSYDLLVHVPIGGTLSADGVRAVDPVFQRAIDERLERELVARGIPALRLDPDGRDHWIDRVEEAALALLKPRQLQIGES
jgi:nicotinamide riboside kinase